MIKKRLEDFLNKSKIEYNSIIKLMGDASSRVYLRVEGNFDFTDDKSLIAMVMPLNIETAEKGDTSFIKEEPFLNMQRYLIKSRLNIPKIYINDDNARIYLLEDLSDITLFKKIEKEGRAELELYYKKAIEQLIIFQDYTQNNIDDSVYCFKREFDYTTLKWELDHFVEWRVEKGLNLTLTDAQKLIIEEKFKEITLKLEVLPKIIVHRDFQSKNIMIKDNKYYLIDFQDALKGSEVYDLVALLKDSYVSLDEDFVTKMLKFYISKTKKLRGIDINFEYFYNIFKLQTLQRKLKDTGRFHYIDLVRKNSSFLQYIPLSVKYVNLYLKELYPELYEIFQNAL